ncbi:hypothetical protein [Caulobacter sp. CCUG 60055]|uniref:hypothetical protein n=1 Tax=Caulobacter sp. CCUG 60055 TaxID=2100090 RepID=UPI001FA80AAC|nr:hypothetical protein [Caulobacter sp. CCUG 60055]
MKLAALAAALLALLTSAAGAQAVGKTVDAADLMDLKGSTAHGYRRTASTRS